MRSRGCGAGGVHSTKVAFSVSLAVTVRLCFGKAARFFTTGGAGILSHHKQQVMQQLLECCDQRWAAPLIVLPRSRCVIWWTGWTRMESCQPCQLAAAPQKWQRKRLEVPICPLRCQGSRRACYQIRAEPEGHLLGSACCLLTAWALCRVWASSSLTCFPGRPHTLAGQRFHMAMQMFSAV